MEGRRVKRTAFSRIVLFAALAAAIAPALVYRDLFDAAALEAWIAAAGPLGPLLYMAI